MSQDAAATKAPGAVSPSVSLADLLAELSGAGAAHSRAVKVTLNGRPVTVAVARVPAFASAFIRKMYPMDGLAERDTPLVITKRRAGVAALGVAIAAGDAPAVTMTMSTEERTRAEAWIDEKVRGLAHGLDDVSLLALEQAAAGEQNDAAEALKN